MFYNIRFKRELTLFQRRGTGTPKRRNRQAHAIQKYSMNIAHKSLLFENYQFSTLRRSANAMLYIKAIGFSTYAVIVL